MTYSIRFAQEAQAQLEAIQEYITQASPCSTKAARFVEGIVDYCESFETFPERGTRRDDLLPGLRIIGYRRSVTVAFRVNTVAKTVSVVGVFYGGQDYDTALGEPPNQHLETSL
jgi:plasmid stabilization system protein ParE